MVKEIKYFCQKHEWLLLAAVGSFVGAMFFLSFYGKEVLDVTYTDWLLNGGRSDLSQHYLGWAFFRRSPWQFPFGLMEGITGYPESIVYTDSIPVLAIICKIFRAFLPETFQYFGLWGFLSFSLMGALSVILIRRFTDSKWCCFIGCMFFVASPYMMQRMFSHTALAGHWVILLAVILWVYDVGQTSIDKKILAWSMVVCLAAMVHIYLIPMVLAFTFADAVRYAFLKRNILCSVAVVMVPVTMTAIVLYLLGVFSLDRGFSNWGLGLYSANVNAFINPIGDISSFMHELPSIPEQYEGMGYLGLGVILMSIFVMGICLWNMKREHEEWKRNKIFVILTILLIVGFYLLALSNKVTMGENTILFVPLPGLFLKVLNTFRSTGRFIWVSCYLIMFGGIVIICKKYRSGIAAIMLSVLCLIQAADLFPYYWASTAGFRERTSYENPLDNEAWELVCENKKKIVMIPFEYAEQIFDIVGAYAVERDLSLNNFYSARSAKEVLREQMMQDVADIKGGQASPDNIYMFSNLSGVFYPGMDLYFYDINGFVIGLRDEMKELEDISYVKPLARSNEMEIPFNELLQNWGELQIGEDGSILLHPGDELIGPQYLMKSGEYIYEISGSGVENLRWKANSDEHQEVIYELKVIEISDDYMRFKVELPRDDLYYRISAECLGDGEVLVEGVKIIRVE